MDPIERSHGVGELTSRTGPGIAGQHVDQVRNHRQPHRIQMPNGTDQTITIAVTITRHLRRIEHVFY